MSLSFGPKVSRQEKLSAQIMKDISVVIREFTATHHPGMLVSVVDATVTADLSVARVYISVFPFDKTEMFMTSLENSYSKIKHKWAGMIRNSMQRIPQLTFYSETILEDLAQTQQKLSSDRK